VRLRVQLAAIGQKRQQFITTAMLVPAHSLGAAQRIVVGRKAGNRP
jgi:hypothetical protein